MFLRLLLPLLMIFALPAFAKDIPCDLHSGPEACVRVFACVGDKGKWFDGRASGVREGRIEGVMSDGTVCTGTWRAARVWGPGKSTLDCEDGSKARVLYNYRDKRTKTAEGDGRTNNGETIKVWAGPNVLTYLNRSGKGARLPCPGGAIALD